MTNGIRKILRFIKIYGITRTLVKVAGRMRLSVPLKPLLSILHPIKKGPRVGIIGCGQFSYSAIAYFLTNSTNAQLRWCCDIDLQAANSMAVAFGIPQFSDSLDKITGEVDLVYIASNHATHTDYAIACMQRGADVYVEKPVSTTWEQFNRLLEAVVLYQRRIYVGYNRPHSPAIAMICGHVRDQEKPLTLSCFVSGHFIPDDHWYRNPEEGTRVCGNLGHWLDLAVFLFYQARQVPDSVDIAISYSDKSMPSDNFCVTLTTDRGDLVTLTFSSRNEPFEGVNETINFQQDNLIAKIDDHRKTQIWIAEKHLSKRHWPKNVGHKKAILQPFAKTQSRRWPELIASTRLMLVVTDMVNALETFRHYRLDPDLTRQEK